MTPTRQGSIHLFRFAGIDVYLNWLWFLAPVYFMSTATGTNFSWFWSILACVALFVIVLLHEFGHALACRQVGGQANLIVLWPLGGVAYVAPPQRPGPVLWSIAAGPLVNVALVPILWTICVLAHSAGMAEAAPNAYTFLWTVFGTNCVLLFFNMLPIYPLDGGQVLQCLLWFVFGRARSLMIATIVGFVGVAGLAGWVVLTPDARGRTWLLILCVFILLLCWRGLMQARMLALVAKLPRRDGFACPSCRQPPIIGPLWQCEHCGQRFDTFATQGVCPHCGAQFAVTRCPECGSTRPLAEWVVVPPKL